VERLSDRAFGYTLGGVTGALATYSAWKGQQSTVLGMVSAALIVLAMIFPVALLPLNRLWHALIKQFLVLTNYVVLGIAFLCLFVPAATIMRLVKIDPMTRRFDQQAPTYWTPVFRQTESDTLNDMF